MVVEGEDVDVSRHIIGKTNPSEATPGSIRGDLGLTVGRNVFMVLIQLNRQREINVWFKEEELSSYEAPRDTWLYE